MENNRFEENNEMIPVAEPSGLIRGIINALIIEFIVFGGLVAVGLLLSLL